MIKYKNFKEYMVNVNKDKISERLRDLDWKKFKGFDADDNQDN